MPLCFDTPLLRWRALIAPPFYAVADTAPRPLSIAIRRLLMPPPLFRHMLRAIAAIDAAPCFRHAIISPCDVMLRDAACRC